MICSLSQHTVSVNVDSHQANEAEQDEHQGQQVYSIRLGEEHYRTPFCNQKTPHTHTGLLQDIGASHVWQSTVR